METTNFKLDTTLGDEALPAVRYERKFLVNDFALEEVLSLLRMQTACFSQLYPARWVNSIYLDTPNLRHYYVHINGVPNRYKVRVRWYGELSGEIEKPQLEFKIRRGQVGGKIVQPLPSFYLEEEAPARSLTEYLAQAPLQESAADYLKMLTPTLLNRYWRHYLISKDGLYRLTIDSGLEFYDPQGASRQNFNLNSGVAIPIILELKFLPAYVEGAQAITNGLPFRLTRCSKYILGIERAFGISS